MKLMFVTVEGPNGVGKSSFINALKKNIELEYTIFCTKEPTDTEFGQKVRLNEDNIGGLDYAKMISEDRKNHLELVILPMQKKYDVVVSDRYIESSLVLQTFDGVPFDIVWALNENFLIPDLSIILYAAETEIQRRLNERKLMTRFEKKMSRKEELELYKKAGAFLEEKGYNVLEIKNDNESDLNSNVNYAVQLICRKLQEHSL